MTDFDTAASDPAASEPAGPESAPRVSAPRVSAAADAQSLVDKYAQLKALLADIAATTSQALSDEDLLEVAATHEQLARSMESVGNRHLADINQRGTHHKAGYQTLTTFMAHRLRITDPVRRKKRLDATTPPRNLFGDTLDVEHPDLADAHADGDLTADHAHAVLDILDKIPHNVDPEVAADAEATLVGYARTMSPTEINQIGQRLLAHIDPDGTLTEPRDRARRRKVWLSRPDAQLMSRLEGLLDPLTRELLDQVFTVWAASGMNNPDDPDSPVGRDTDADPDALAAAAERDDRTQAQRNHDALHAMARYLLDSGALGTSHRGLPPHLIVTISEDELRERAGFGRTANGNLLPINDVIELAARAQHHLAVFANHTHEVLYLGTAQRLANRAQRLALAAAYGGCSAPGCTRPASRVEIHHAALDYAKGGTTDITTLAPACGPHNRRVGDKPGQYTTQLVTEGPDAGLYSWTLNTHPDIPDNPPQVNHYFRATLHPINPTGPAENIDTASTTGTHTDETSTAPTPSAPPPSIVEDFLHQLLHPPQPATRTDIRWRPPGHLVPT